MTDQETSIESFVLAASMIGVFIFILLVQFEYGVVRNPIEEVLFSGAEVALLGYWLFTKGLYNFAEKKTPKRNLQNT